MGKNYSIKVAFNSHGEVNLKESDGWKWCDSADGSHYFQNKKTKQELICPVANTVIYVTEEQNE